MGLTATDTSNILAAVLSVYITSLYVSWHTDFLKHQYHLHRAKFPTSKHAICKNSSLYYGNSNILSYSNLNIPGVFCPTVI